MKTIIRTLAMLGALALVSGCQNAYELRLEHAPQIVGDVERARDLARAADPPDVIAEACYDVLIPALSKWRDYPEATSPAEVFQRTRLLRRFLDSDRLKVGCGPLLDDSTSSVVGLIRRFGVP
jgi:hypothetical protein